MKGNTLNEFMSDLLVCGGPEKEFNYGDKVYIVQGEQEDGEEDTGLRFDVYRKSTDDIDGDFIETIIFTGKDYRECVAKFEKAKIFDGKTIYEAEKDIEVLYG